MRHEHGTHGLSLSYETPGRYPWSSIYPFLIVIDTAFNWRGRKPLAGTLFLLLLHVPLVFYLLRGPRSSFRLSVHTGILCTEVILDSGILFLEMLLLNEDNQHWSFLSMNPVDRRPRTRSRDGQVI